MVMFRLVKGPAWWSVVAGTLLGMATIGTDPAGAAAAAMEPSDPIAAVIPSPRTATTPARTGR
jgi:hypothetical protein